MPTFIERKRANQSKGVLRKPLLYLSLYMKQHRGQYYDRLQAVRTQGDWEGWLKFFLSGVAAVADGATDTARDILNLRERHRQLIHEKVRGAANALHLLEILFQQPVITASRAAAMLGVSYPTASNLIDQLVRQGVLQESTGAARNRLFRYHQYLELFE